MKEGNLMEKKIILCILFFLYGLNNTSFSIGSVRIRLLHIFGLLLAIILFKGFIVEKEGVKKFFKDVLRCFSNKENGYSIFMMSIWFVYALISFFWVLSIPDWHLAISFFIVGIFCTITFSLFLRTRKDLFQAFQVMGIISIIHNIIGWYEVITQDHLFGSRHRWGTRPVSFFYNTNNFAVFLFFAVFILYAIGENSKNICLKIFYKIASASSMLLIYLTQSRGVFLGLIFSLIILIAFSNIDNIKNYKKRLSTKVLIIFVALATIAVVAILVYMLTVGLDGSNEKRIMDIKNGFTFLFATNGFGVGAGNIEYWIEAHLYFISPRNSSLNMHNWWMEILAAYGVVIFALYLIFYYKLFKNNFSKFFKSDNLIDKSFSKAMLSIMGGFLIVSAVPSTLIFHLFHWVFWAVAIAFQGVPLEDRVWRKK